MTARPRVAHFTVAPEFVDKIMLHDLRRLGAREEITVIVTEGVALGEARREGFRILTVDAHRKLSPFADVRTIWQLYRLFRRERFDLLHTYTPKAGLLGQLAGWLARIPRRVHGCRGLLYTDTLPSWKRRIFRMTDRVTSGLADVTLFLSTADRDFAVAEGLCAPQRATLIGSGVDLVRFAPSGDARRAGLEFRERLGLAPEHTVVLTVGRFVADKGYREAAAAARRLRDDFPHLRYLWVAPVLAGEDGVLSASLPAEHGVDDIVRVVDYMEDIMPALAAADLLLHPSHREGVPRVVMEASAMGIPIVASDIPGCREVLTHEETALLFTARSPEALEAALRRTLDDRGAAQKRADRAAATVRARFDQDTLSARVWAVHAQLLARGHARRD